MVQASSCRRIIYDNFTSKLIPELKSALEANDICVDFKDLLSLPEVPSELSSLKPSGDKRTVVPYPPLSTSQNPGQVVLYLNTFGYSGQPKTIPFTFVHTMEWFQGSYFVSCQ